MIPINASTSSSVDSLPSAVRLQQSLPLPQHLTQHLLQGTSKSLPTTREHLLPEPQRLLSHPHQPNTLNMWGALPVLSARPARPSRILYSYKSNQLPESLTMNQPSPSEQRSLYVEALKIASPIVASLPKIEQQKIISQWRGEQSQSDLNHYRKSGTTPLHALTALADMVLEEIPRFQNYEPPDMNHIMQQANEGHPHPGPD